MIRRCDNRDFELIWPSSTMARKRIRELSQPTVGWSRTCLARNCGVKSQMVWAFWGYEESGTLAGVMGIQQVQDVTLIRHAYVRTGNQKRGIGAHLLSHLPVPMNQFRQRKHLTNIHRHMKCSQTQEQ
jgi:hypothetical protein